MGLFEDNSKPRGAFRSGGTSLHRSPTLGRIARWHHPPLIGELLARQVVSLDDQRLNLGRAGPGDVMSAGDHEAAVIQRGTLEGALSQTRQVAAKQLIRQLCPRGYLRLPKPPRMTQARIGHCLLRRKKQVIGRQQRDATERYPAVADNECLLANDTAVGGVERLQLETVGAPAEQKAEICPDAYP